MFSDVTSYGFVAQHPIILMFICTVMMEAIPSSVTSVRTSNSPRYHTQKDIFLSVVLFQQCFVISINCLIVSESYGTFQFDVVGVTRGLH